MSIRCCYPTRPRVSCQVGLARRGLDPSAASPPATRGASRSAPRNTPKSTQEETGLRSEALPGGPAPLRHDENSSHPERCSTQCDAHSGRTAPDAFPATSRERKSTNPLCTARLTLVHQMSRIPSRARGGWGLLFRCHQEYTPNCAALADGEQAHSTADRQCKKI